MEQQTAIFLAFAALVIYYLATSKKDGFSSFDVVANEAFCESKASRAQREGKTPMAKGDCVAAALGFQNPRDWEEVQREAAICRKHASDIDLGACLGTRLGFKLPAQAADQMKVGAYLAKMGAV